MDGCVSALVRVKRSNTQKILGSATLSETQCPHHCLNSQANFLPPVGHTPWRGLRAQIFDNGDHSVSYLTLFLEKYGHRHMQK